MTLWILGSLIDSWLNESLTPWLNASLTQWITDLLTQWFADWMTRGLNALTTCWLTASVAHWLTDSLNDWVIYYLKFCSSQTDCGIWIQFKRILTIYLSMTTVYDVELLVRLNRSFFPRYEDIFSKNSQAFTNASSGLQSSVGWQSCVIIIA